MTTPNPMTSTGPTTWPKPTAQRPTIAVVTDYVHVEYQIQMISGFEEELTRHGWAMMICSNDPESRHRTAPLAALLASGMVAGVLFTPISDAMTQDQTMAMVDRAGLPQVMVGAQRFGRLCVTADNDVGMRELMRHVLDETGRRQVAFIRGLPHHSDAVAREAVVRSELASRGLTLDPALVIDGRFDRETAYLATAELLKYRPPLNAIVAANDRSALGALDALISIGIRVPEEVAVTGFDDERGVDLYRPALTTVTQNVRQQGVLGARLLLEIMAGRDSLSDIQVPSRLIRRASTGIAEGATDESWRSNGSSPAHEAIDLDAVMSCSRNLMACESAAELVQALASCIPRLGIERCFLALDDDAAEPGQVPGAHHPSAPNGQSTGSEPKTRRLRLARHHSEAALLTDLRLPPGQLLPPAFQAELGRGWLLIQPISVEGSWVGHVLFQQSTTSHFTAAELLRMHLSRALATMRARREREDYARRLEEVVAQRTRQLAAEVLERARAESELRTANAELGRLMRLDTLTGIANRAALDEYLVEMWAWHQERGEPLALLMVDVDAFKAYNDRYGHLAGDDCLTAVAEAVRQATRSQGDLAARFGGEEFVVVLPETGSEGAMVVAERLIEGVRSRRMAHDVSTVAPWVTVSVGLATQVPTRDRSAIDLLQAADHALYQAKQSGRDRIVVSTSRGAGEGAGAGTGGNLG